MSRTLDRYCAACEDWVASDPCEQCGEDTRPQATERQRDDWDEQYERQAARDRSDGFERTGGKDWT